MQHPTNREKLVIIGNLFRIPELHLKTTNSRSWKEPMSAESRNPMAFRCATVIVPVHRRRRCCTRRLQPRSEMKIPVAVTIVVAGVRLNLLQMRNAARYNTDDFELVCDWSYWCNI